MDVRSIAPLAGVCLVILGGIGSAAHAADPAPEGPVPTGADLGVRISSLPDRRVPGPSERGGTYTARILIGTAVRRRPGRAATEWYAGIRTKWSGASQHLMVLESREVRGKMWLKVRLPIRPNRAAGWIPRDRVRLTLSRRYILIDRSRRLLRVYRKGRVVARFKVVVGARATPTPVGLFALYDRVPQADPNGFIGPWAMPLTAHSEPLRRYDGGPGLVALHGRAGASLLDPLGTARSHGCVRMNNSRIRHLTKYDLGTAVRIKQ
ncbi:MAG TPA: L,D-transpeptidase [Solirubrobacterales bacterium]|nr:L,D-transpeptidase [Solirubrobacterales bacterium]